ncbi:MAG: hypothetical protein IJ223_06280 [Clostridia bacterium]|nr:hypothetical protein [Clostridia bacterium]
MDGYVVRDSSYPSIGAYNLLNANGEFTIPSGWTVEEDVPGNGYGAQNFTTVGASSLWRVLDVNETTGVIKIVPETPIKTTENDYFFIKGLRGYKNAVTELDNISSIFGHGQGANGAESIKVEEVNALTGYIVTPPVSATSFGEVGSWYSTYYSYREDESLATNIKSMIFKNKYWIASPNTYVSSYFKRVTFSLYGVCSANFNGEVKLTMAGANAFSVDDKGECRNVEGIGYGVMPVVSLRPDVVKLGGTGESSTPWTFQATE